jgi:hypothetical protein
VLQIGGVAALLAGLLAVARTPGPRPAT